MLFGTWLDVFPFQIWGCGVLAAASFTSFHQVASCTAAACEAFSRLFALGIFESSNWLGTPAGHNAFASAYTMLLYVIEVGSIATRAMAPVVCFWNGSGHVQGPVASSLAVCWDDLLHVLGLRIVVQGCGGRQARGLSVAWLAQATPRVDVQVFVGGVPGVHVLHICPDWSAAHTWRKLLTWISLVAISWLGTRFGRVVLWRNLALMAEFGSRYMLGCWGVGFPMLDMSSV